MRHRSSLVPWLLVLTTGVGGLGLGPLLSGMERRALAQSSSEPGWPPPEGTACKPSKSDDEEAQTLFKLAVKAEETSNYPDAIKYYKDAYKRACNRHLILKNLGRVYEKDAQYAAAVESYKLYRVRGKPTGDELDQIDQKIANLSKKVGGGSDTAPTTTASAAPTTTTTSTTTSEPTVTAAPTSTAPPPTTSGGPGVVPWVVAGVGGVLLIGGGILWITSNSTVSAKQEEFDGLSCGSKPNPNDLGACTTIADDGSSAKTTRTIGAVVAGVGFGVAVGGVIWALTAKGGDQKSAKAKTWQLTSGPGLAGIGLVGTF